MFPTLRHRPTVQLMVLAAVCLVAPACEDDDSSPTAPTPVATAPAPTTGGTTPTPATGNPNQVRGTERLAWTQPDDIAGIQFRAYVDNARVDLPAASCNGTDCTSPLPAMADGVHTIAVVGVAGGVEGPRSESITVEKVSTSARGRALDSIVRLDGLEFAADVVATGIRGPAQLAPLPDGRLLVSDANGQIRIVNPAQPEKPVTALEPEFLSSESIGAVGIATHPGFAENHLVYVSLLERDRPGRMHLRVLRLREVGDTLGEPATLFEAPVAEPRRGRFEVEPDASSGPRMAFGPDRLLYVMLPPGLEFVNEPAASAPLASMLRLSDEGRAASEPLSGITASPLAFSWSPTGQLWVMLRGADGVASVRSLDTRARVQALSAEPMKLRVREGLGAEAGTLLLQSAPGNAVVARALVAPRADGSKGLARLALPVQSASGTGDRVVDVAAGNDGALFVAMHDGVSAAGGARSDVVVRLTPLQAR